MSSTEIEIKQVELLKERWWVVDDPFGDGTCVKATNPDCSGQWICDTTIGGFYDWNPEELEKRKEDFTEIAKHIADAHNQYLRNHKVDITQPTLALRLLTLRITDARLPTLRDIEAATGISNPYLSQLETGSTKNPSVFVIMKLCDYYDIGIGSLMDGLKE